MRALRQLEPPMPDEGFAAIERIEFTRTATEGLRPGVFVAAACLDRAFADPDPTAPHLVFDWRPDGTVESLASAVARVAANVSGPVEAAICPHGGGPPVCWCRPPLPGLPLAFAQAYDVDPSASTLVGCSAAHRTLAGSLGARYVGV